jgi:hypothetical protein
MAEKKEPKGISRNTRIYTSLVFLIAFTIITIIWIIFFATYFQPFENITILVIFFLVLGGFAILPLLPILFPREPPGGPPLEDL